MAEAIQAAPAPQSQPTTWVGRILDSDVWASFKRSKLTMAAAFLTFVFFAAAVLAGGRLAVALISDSRCLDGGALRCLSRIVPCRRIRRRASSDQLHPSPDEMLG